MPISRPPTGKSTAVKFEFRGDDSIDQINEDEMDESDEVQNVIKGEEQTDFFQRADIKTDILSSKKKRTPPRSAVSSPMVPDSSPSLNLGSSSKPMGNRRLFLVNESAMPTMLKNNK